MTKGEMNIDPGDEDLALLPSEFDEWRPGKA
jgi:hypothetical protein